jgi:hypothetical protein
MREPIRLLNDPSAAIELRQLLGHAARPRSLDRATRQRMGRRLDRFLALPLVLTMGLTMKTAAASAVHEIRVMQALSTPLVDTPAGSRVQSEPSAASSVVKETLADEPLRAPSRVPSAAFPDEQEPSDEQVGKSAPAPTNVLVKPASHSRASESSAKAATSTARRALGSSPAEALAIADEHRAAFPSARLELERELIRVDALYRLGRHAEARQAAEALRRRGGLYAERVERMIEKMDASQQ